MTRRLSIYIFNEIAVPFLLCLAILTATALLTKVISIVELMLTHGIGPSFIFWFILSVAPSFLIYTIPISFLAAVLVAFTRLSSDCEIIAMKASGLSLFTLMRPVLAFAAAVFIVGLVFTAYIFPWGNFNIKRLLYDVGQSGFTAAIEEKTFYDRFSGTVLYVDHFDRETGRMEGVFISKDEGEGGATVFLAPKGVIAPSAGGSVYLKLYDGTVHRERGDAYHLADFASYTIELRVAGGGPPAADAGGRTNRELYPGELAERVRQVREKGQDPAPYVIDLHKRFVLPASVFVFALIGVPMGVQRVRTARFTGFFTALGVVLLYYLVSTALEALGESGALPPVISVWGSNIIFAAVGAYVFHRAAHDSPMGFTALFARAGLAGRGREASAGGP